MKRVLVILCYLAFAGCLSWFFPLFHIVRNENLESVKLQTVSNAPDIAKTFWSDRLIPSLKQAPEAATVLSALRKDPQAARERFGRKIGVSRTSLFLLQGSGTVVKVDSKGVGVSLQHETKEPDVILQTGLVFGNVVRDATDLLDASKFADSRQFNEVSAELNRLVESQTISVLKEKAAVGRRIDFAGCAEIPDDEKLIGPLKIIPLDIHVK